MTPDHPATARIQAAWRSADRPSREQILGDLPVPGPIALRGRYWRLRDADAPAGPWDPAWSPQTWDTVLRLETEGDEALRRNDTTAATAAFTRLLELKLSESYPVTQVHAYLGLGDIGLVTEGGEETAHHYGTALMLATRAGYQFGRLRALVGLGYVTLLLHSAGAALAEFAEADAVAARVGDLAYRANAQLGLAECHERLGDLDTAVKHATQAYEITDGLASALGRGNTAQRLGSMLHRLGRQQEARAWLERAHAAYVEAGNPMGLTNVLSGLGDLLLDGDDPDGAERAYRAGLEQAEAAGLPRSRAHTLQDLARVTLVRGDWATAAGQFRISLAAYRDLDELLGMSNAADKLARCYARLGQIDDELRIRMEAVFDVEEYRATHRDERAQREYRDRFAGTYAAALAAATQAGSAPAFAVVADCLAGRRLAGLFAETAQAGSAGAGETTLLQELLVRADQRLIGDRRRDSGDAGPGDAGPRRERVIRLLGAMSIRHGLADQARASLEDLLAAVYLPPADEGGALLAALPDDCHVLQVLLDPRDPGLYRWLWRDTAGNVSVGDTALSEAATRLIALVQSDGDERANLRLGHLDALGELVPVPLRAALSGGGSPRLIVIPVGELWLVPWGAIPVDGHRVLGELADYVLCPSLTVQRQLAARGAGRPAAEPQPVDLWCSPFVKQHQLTSFQHDPAWQVHRLRSAEQARERLRAGSPAMIVTGHGRPAAGLGHYLELDQDAWLVPMDLIGAQPPRRLAMIACWGGPSPVAAPRTRSAWPPWRWPPAPRRSWPPWAS